MLVKWKVFTLVDCRFFSIFDPIGFIENLKVFGRNFKATSWVRHLICFFLLNVGESVEIYCPLIGKLSI